MIMPSEKKTVKEVDEILKNTESLTDSRIIQLINNSTYTFAAFFKKYKNTRFVKYANLLISNHSRLTQLLDYGHIPEIFETKYIQFDIRKFQETCLQYCLDVFLNSYTDNNNLVINQIVDQANRQSNGLDLIKKIVFPFVYNFKCTDHVRKKYIGKQEFILDVVYKLGTPLIFKDDIKRILKQTIDPSFEHCVELINLIVKRYSCENIITMYSECLPEYTNEQILHHLFSKTDIEFKLANLTHFKSVLYMFPHHVEDHISRIVTLPNYLEIFERISSDGKLTPKLIKSIFDDRSCRNNTDMLIQIMKVIKETDRIVMLDFVKYFDIKLSPDTIKYLFVTGVQTKNQALFKYAHPDLAATLDEPIRHTVDPIVEQIGVLLQIHSLRTK